MLREYWLNRIALICGIIGTIIVFYYSLLVKPIPLSIGEINESIMEKRVEINGRVDWRYEKNSVLLFNLFDGNRVKVVKFQPSAGEKFLVQKNSFLKVVGRVQEYKGELEIVAEEIESND